MAAPGPDESEPEQPAAPATDSSMEVERVRLDDGRALLLFSWDDPA